MTKQRVTSMVLGCFALLAVTMIASGPATAAIVSMPVPVSGSFGTSLSASGSLSVGANFNVTLTAGSIAGTPVSVTVPLNIPTQSQAISLIPNPTNVNTAASGTLDLGLEDANNNGLADDFPGAAFPPPALPDSALDAVLNDLDLTLVGAGGVGLQTSSINVGGTASLDILGLITIDLPVTATIDADATLSNLAFNGDGGGFLLGKSAINSSFGVPFPMTEDYSVEYASGLIGGTASGDIEGNVNAELEVDLGIFGSITQSIDNAATLSESISEVIPLVGAVTLEQIFTANPIHDDLNVAFDVALDDALDLDLALSDTQAFNEDFDVPIDLGILGSFTLDGDITGSVDFDIDATFTVANTSLESSGTKTAIVDNVIPEPSTWCMAALALLGIVPMIRRRMKA